MMGKSTSFAAGWEAYFGQLSSSRHYSLIDKCVGCRKTGRWWSTRAAFMVCVGRGALLEFPGCDFFVCG